MPIADWLTQSADVYVRRQTWTADGAEVFGTPELRSAGLACRVVRESPSTVRVFLAAGTRVWEAGDQYVELRIGDAVYVLRPDSANAILGLEYGQVDYGDLPGAHVEIVAEDVLLS